MKEREKAGAARGLRARFITTTRDDLAAAARLLCGAVMAAGLPPDGTPVMIGVNGTLQSGKKIVSDMAVESLFDPGGAVMHGKAGYDEYWRGARDGAPFGVDYIDMAYPYRADYSARLAHARMAGRFPDNNMAHKFGDFVAGRTAPGLTFVQNPAAFNERAALSLYIESRIGAMPGITPVGYKVPRQQIVPPSVKRAFHNAAHGNGWARLVEIEVRDRRLTEDGAFNAAFAAFAPACVLDGPRPSGWRARDAAPAGRETEPRGLRGDVKIFGRDGFPYI